MYYGPEPKEDYSRDYAYFRGIPKVFGGKAAMTAIILPQEDYFLVLKMFFV
jgi:hypothetical protein